MTIDSILGDKAYRVNHGRFDDNNEKDVSTYEPRDKEDDKRHIAKGIWGEISQHLTKIAFMHHE